MRRDEPEQIDYENLEPEQQEIVDQLNLDELLENQLSAGELNIGLMKFVLRRMGQIGTNYDAAFRLISEAEKCYPVFADVMQYLLALRDVPGEISQKVGAEVLDLLRSSIVGHLPYHRCWLLSMFAGSDIWGQQDQLVSLYNEIPDPFSRRKAILAMGRAKQSFWFRANRDSIMNFDPWMRRAFLAGATCLEADERKYWFRSLRGLDILEGSVVAWASANPF